MLVRPTSQETIDANGGILLWDDVVRHREDAQIHISYYCLDNEPEVRGCPFVESRLKMHLRETEVVPLQVCNGQRGLSASMKVRHCTGSESFILLSLLRSGLVSL